MGNHVNQKCDCHDCTQSRYVGTLQWQLEQSAKNRASSPVVSETGVQALDALMVERIAKKICEYYDLAPEHRETVMGFITEELAPFLARAAASVLTEEQPKSCLLCGQIREKAVVHMPSGVFVCMSCRDNHVDAHPDYAEASHPQDERERFEEWAKDKSHDCNWEDWAFERDKDGCYEAISVETAWRSWQAALASRIRK